MSAIARHKTAIRRGDLSRPVKLILEQGLLHPGQTFFDYGCGQGEDVEYLCERGFEAAGWDPFHRPQAPRLRADVVALTYVLNVIEDAAERQAALQRAWKLCDEFLVVTTLVTGDKPGRYLLPYADGVVTGQGTFQKYFQQDELRSFIEDVLPDVEAVPLALGVFVLFRDSTAARAFEIRRFRRRLEGQLATRTRGNERDLEPHVERLHQFLLERGRFPRDEELEPVRTAISALGGKTRAERFLHLKFGDEMESARVTREDDLLVFLALDQFKRRRTKLSALPRPTQLDIRAFFGTHKKANAIAEFLLFGLGEDGTIAEACRRSPVGKLMPDALYVHSDYVHTLPVTLRVLEGLATSYVGRVDGATLLKIDKHEPRVSYLFYPQFDTEAHPPLRYAVIAELGRLNARFLDFSMSSNPPILHRKELFVGKDYSNWAKFRSLTLAEEESGLFSAPSRIGNLEGWHSVLQEHDLVVRGHSLLGIHNSKNWSNDEQ